MLRAAAGTVSTKDPPAFFSLEVVEKFPLGDCPLAAKPAVVALPALALCGVSPLVLAIGLVLRNVEHLYNIERALSQVAQHGPAEAELVITEPDAGRPAWRMTVPRDSISANSFQHPLTLP